MRLFLCPLTLVIISTSSPIFAEVDMSGNHKFEEGFFLVGHLSQISEGPLFNFDPEIEGVFFSPSGMPLRLWGVNVISGPIPEAVLSQRWRCHSVGDVEDSILRGAIALSCEQDGQLLSENLLRMNLATEDCLETRNYYGTCTSSGENR